MNSPAPHPALEAQITEWRTYLLRRQAIAANDVAELEDHLREQVDGLVAAGLHADEAFLVAVKRLGSLDTLSREFAHEHSERLWKQLVAFDDNLDPLKPRTEAIVAFGLAVLAAFFVKLPGFFGIGFDGNDSFYLRNAAFFVLPLLTGFFAWKRQLAPRTVVWLAAGFISAGFAINSLPFTPGGQTEALAALHLPIALWLLVGIAYAGPRWQTVAGRMDFIRFSGELFIYFVLLALGGGLVAGMSAALFTAIGIDIEPVFEQWIAPTAPAGGVLVAAWLVEAKQSVIENMAPVLTRIFTPFFAAALLLFLAVFIGTGRHIQFDRDVLIAFDLVLALALALMLYSISARDPRAAPNGHDVAAVVLVVAALLTDVVALAAMAARITDLGFTPNRLAALGENLVLLVNLSWAAALYLRFLRGTLPFERLERWQTSYLPVYAGWALFVVVGFPLIFAFR